MEEPEKDDLIEAYRIQLDIWKVHNENHFKRVHVLMLVIQAALFTAAIKIIELQNILTELKFGLLLLLYLFGGLVSWNWIRMNQKQNQYLEYCRRTLRNIECKLVECKVPIRYFALESKVFHRNQPNRELPKSAGTEAKEQDIDRQVFAHFTWSGEYYPDSCSNIQDIHHYSKVKGKLINCEEFLARATLSLWFFGFWYLVGSCIIEFLPSYILTP